jgi:hypothetical protein
MFKHAGLHWVEFDVALAGAQGVLLRQATADAHDRSSARRRVSGSRFFRHRPCAIQDKSGSPRQQEKGCRLLLRSMKCMGTLGSVRRARRGIGFAPGRKRRCQFSRKPWPPIFMRYLLQSHIGIQKPVISSATSGFPPPTQAFEVMLFPGMTILNF